VCLQAHACAAARVWVDAVVTGARLVSARTNDACLVALQRCDLLSARAKLARRAVRSASDDAGVVMRGIVSISALHHLLDSCSCA
jgi:hypothetical protein